jgi:hypothetical protein
LNCTNWLTIQSSPLGPTIIVDQWNIYINQVAHIFIQWFTHRYTQVK